VHNAVLDGTPGVGGVLRRLADTATSNDATIEATQ
jgi:hypothetical protein